VKRLFTILAMFGLLACKGPIGPTGPTGAQGPQGLAGPPGPGTGRIFSATINAAGTASVALPAAAGTVATNPPAMTCYEGPANGSGYLAIADGDGTTTGTYCGFVSPAAYSTRR